MSGSIINIKTEIDRLFKIEKEKTELYSYFTKHKDQQDDALLDLNRFDTNEKKFTYLRTFLKSNDFSSMKRDIAHIVKEELNHEIKKLSIKIDRFFQSEKSWKVLSPPNGDNDILESQIQEYFISECQALEKFGAINNKLIIKDTHASPSLGTQKSDFIFIQKGSTVDLFNVVVVVYRIDSAINSEIFTRYTYNHINSEYLAFAKEGENKGWKYLVKPSLKFSTNIVKLVKCIGMGRTSVVYEGTFNEESVAVKMAKKAEYFSCLECERNALQELSDLKSPHIPKIILHNENTLVMTPLGVKIHNLQKEDINDIIKILESTHSLNYVHRDLRKYNFICDESGKIVVIDWGYCIKTDTDYDSSFAGALKCMPDEVLSSIIKKKKIFYSPKVDLVCLVRSFYLMLHRPSLTGVPFNKNDYDDISIQAQYILNFWKDCEKSDIWRNIYSAIDDLDYNRLIQELEKLF
ncbi:kinase-like protein [Rhizophagus irregularis]|uniref:Kinase-like protein n=1 Tax=Rhizophagus irregularis TaxID=588596 RepID=A0A2N0NNW7_9GLOM|nr:kinase-like protein [Rhizophagus irregularis]